MKNHLVDDKCERCMMPAGTRCESEPSTCPYKKPQDAEKSLDEITASYEREDDGGEID